MHDQPDSLPDQEDFDRLLEEEEVEFQPDQPEPEEEYDPDWRRKPVVILDPRVPKEYRGRTWPHVTVRDGVIELRVPPIRDDPQGPLTEAFSDFRLHHVTMMPIRHPEWYCDEHGEMTKSTQQPDGSWLKEPCGRCIRGMIERGEIPEPEAKKRTSRKKRSNAEKKFGREPEHYADA